MGDDTSLPGLGLDVKEVPVMDERGNGPRSIGDMLDIFKERGSVNKTNKKPIKEFKQQKLGEQLPVWPDDVRGTANSFLRSALFSAIQSPKRLALKERTLIGSQLDMSIYFTGWQFDQGDLDVLEEVIQRARFSPLGSDCFFSVNDFLKSIARTSSTASYHFLENSIARLTAGAVEIKVGNKAFVGSFIDTAYRDEDTGQYCLKLNPGLLELYRSGYTGINWSIRKKLIKKPLSQWLFGYYSSHADKVHPVKVETLHFLCGSNNQNLRSFREKIKAALTDLVSLGVLVSWVINDDKVSVEKIAKESK